MSHTHALRLNADMTPMSVVPVLSGHGKSGAIELLFEEKVYTVESVPGKFVRSQTLVIPWPSVIAMRRYTHHRPRVKFDPKAVILRDGGVCSYCGFRPLRPDGRIDVDQLTHDHVIPCAQARDGRVFLPWSRKWVNLTGWENATTACATCNNRKKRDRTPAQAGMVLRTLPRVPTANDVIRMALSRLRHIPEQWLPYLPELPRFEVEDRALELVSAG